jgi:hypothetical protein
MPLDESAITTKSDILPEVIQLLTVHRRAIHTVE